MWKPLHILVGFNCNKMADKAIDRAFKTIFYPITTDIPIIGIK
jgi:hypothetical protein